MHQMLSFINYKDRNYILLLIAVVLCFSSFQSILVPSLDYIALNIKNNNHLFYNFATVAALAASLPQASSLLAGYFVNHLTYKRLVTMIFGVVTLFCVLILFFLHNFIMYTIFVIACGTLFNALLFGLDRQIVTLCSGRIREFQNDLLILGSILAILNYKISNYLFLHFGLYGIISHCMLSNIIMYICLNKIYINNKNTANQYNKLKLPNINTILKIFMKHKKLMTFLVVMWSIMFVSSGFTLLITTKIHHENLPVSLWSSNMALMSFGSILGAVICKIRFFKNLNGILVISIGVAIFGTCLFVISKMHTENSLLAFMWFCGFLNPFILVNMNSIFFKYIVSHDELIEISPIAGGLASSIFYIVCLVGPMLLNQLLHIGIGYSMLLASCGILEIALAVILFNINGLRVYFKN